jgi:uncharacterized protein YndB with AHSA1/START domain
MRNPTCEVFAVSKSQWHKFYVCEVAAAPEALFDLLSDLPNYSRWLPSSEQFSATTDVEPYPVRLGSRYHDGKPDGPGKAWWGTVTGFQPPGSIDFHHTIRVGQLRATVDVHIHYSLEDQDTSTAVTRWLVLDFDMPRLVRPLRAAIIKPFDQENLRTMAALKNYAETAGHESSQPAPQSPAIDEQAIGEAGNAVGVKSSPADAS